MASFLISTMPEAGLVHPFLPVATALVSRGHRVFWHTWPSWAAAVERTGAIFVPAHHTPGLAELPPEPDRGTRGIRASLSVIRKHLVERMAGQVADYEKVHDTHGIDATLLDLCCLGAQALYERRGVPWASLGVSPLTLPSPDTPPFGSGNLPPRGGFDRTYNRTYHHLARIVMRGLTSAYNEHRASLGMPRLRRGESIADHMVSPQLHLQASTPIIEFPRRAWPANVRLVGPLLPTGPAAPQPPSWWPKLDEARLVIHVTQGTIVADPDTLIGPTLRALAGLDAQIVVTTPAPDRVGPVPPNTVVAKSVPHALLLPRVQLMITNGGFNGTKMALAHGIPLIIAPWGNDQPDVAARVAWAGAGIDLRSRRPTPAAVGAAVQEVLSDVRYRQAAARIRAEFAEYDGGRHAAALLERFADQGS